MALFKLRISLLLITCLALTLSLGERAKRNKPIVWTKLGQDVELGCSSGERSKSLNVCGWTRSSALDSKTPTIHLNTTNNGIIAPGSSGQFEFFGSGMENGECNLRIRNVSIDQIGNWECTLGGDDAFWTANILVSLYEKPGPPVISDRGPLPRLQNLMELFNSHYDQVHLNEKPGPLAVIGLLQSLQRLSRENVIEQLFNPIPVSQKRCCVSGGKPIEAIELNFYHRDRLLTPLRSFQDGHSTCIVQNTQFVPEDNGQALKCVVKHPAFDHNHFKLEDQLAVFLIQVKYPPEVIMRNSDGEPAITEHMETEETNIEITFNVKANPKPNVRLFLEKEIIDQFATLESSYNITQITENEYQCELAIWGLSTGEVYKYIITVYNEIGSSDFQGTIKVYDKEQDSLKIRDGVKPNQDDAGKKDRFWTCLIVVLLGLILYAIAKSTNDARKIIQSNANAAHAPPRPTVNVNTVNNNASNDKTPAFTTVASVHTYSSPSNDPESV